MYSSCLIALFVFPGTAIAVLTVVILILRFCIKTFAVQGKPWSMYYIQHFVKYFIIGVTVLVVAVPEGLPLAVTLALAYSVRVSTVELLFLQAVNAYMGNCTVFCHFFSAISD